VLDGIRQARHARSGSWLRVVLMGRPDPAQRALMLEPEALHRADSLEAAKQRLGEFLEQSPERDNHRHRHG
jgi:hypothetical protein